MNFSGSVTSSATLLHALREELVSYPRRIVRVIVHVAMHLFIVFTDADLACERGRCYIHGLLNADPGSVSGRSMATADEEAAVFDRARKLWGNGPHPLIQDKMYYI